MNTKFNAIRDCVAHDVACGFLGRQQVVDGVVSRFGEQFEMNDLREVAEQIFDEELRAHLKIQAAWPDQTDCDRLEDAFAELELSGIV